MYTMAASWYNILTAMDNMYHGEPWVGGYSTGQVLN
jgi:hypothetical protein